MGGGGGYVRVCGESCPKLRIPREARARGPLGSLFARARCPGQSIAARGRGGHFGLLPPNPSVVGP